MKKLALIFLLALPFTIKAQTWSAPLGNALSRATVSSVDYYRFNLGALGFWYPQKGSILSCTTLAQRNALPTAIRQLGTTVYVADSLKHYFLKTGLTNSDWAELGGSEQETITAGVISSVPTVGFNPGTNLTPGEFIEASFYQSQVPTASLTGGIAQELHSAGTYSGTLNWNAGRQAATQPISVINVAGIAQSFSQPAAGGSVSGTQAVSMAYNNQITYTNTVTTTDSKVAQANTTFTWLPKYYYGRSSSATPDQTIILATAGGSSALSSGHSGTFTITASGANYPFFAYPSSQSVLVSILDVNGFNVTSSFNITTVSITNASGYTQNYRVYTLNSATSASYQITVN